MKLVIESETALHSAVASTFLRPRSGPEGVVIPIALKRQARSNWCWAALACALARYYHDAAPSQEEMATRVLGSDRAGDDVETRLDHALQAAGCFSHWSPGKPALDRIRFEINHGRPICLRIAWHDGAAHYAMVHGYAHDTEQLHIADPLYGPALHALTDFPSTYHRRGAWTETFWTAPGTGGFPSERTSNGRL